MAGTVVLASDTPFSREVLAGYENAYFFDPFKPEQLADLMSGVLEKRIQRKTLALEDTGCHDSWEDVISLVLEYGKDNKSR